MKYLVICIIFFSNVVFASTERGVIERILVKTTNPTLAYIQISGDSAGKPGCATDVWEYVVDISSDTGKALYSLALSSHMAKKPPVSG